MSLYFPCFIKFRAEFVSLSRLAMSAKSAAATMSDNRRTRRGQRRFGEGCGNLGEGDSARAVAIWQRQFGGGCGSDNVIFGRRQEWSDWGRGIVADSCRLLPILHCEIPAFAGMVYLGIMVCWWIFGIVAHDTVRFLPSQEWSVGGTGNCGNFANCGTRHCEIPAFAGMVYLGIMVCWRIFGIVAHDTVRFLPSQEWSTLNGVFCLWCVRLSSPLPILPAKNGQSSPANSLIISLPPTTSAAIIIVP